MTYALEQLGWLQFQQVCTRLLELDVGMDRSAWVGDADGVRFARCETGLAPPLVPCAIPGPTLIQCAWSRSTLDPAVAPVQRLVREQPAQLEGLRSFLLISDAALEEPLHDPADAGSMRVWVMGAQELSARIDALPRLRLEQPSLLGLRELEPLLDRQATRRSSLHLESAIELAQAFAPTRAHARAVSALDSHNFAVLAGPPEMGKTATARLIALALMTDGFEAHECTSPEDLWRAFDADVSQVFVADDAFGSTEYRPENAERWARAMERLLRTLDERHWLIWTSRPAPLHAALDRLHRERGAERFPSPGRVLVDAGELDATEKALILLRHAKAARLPRALRARLRRHGPSIVADPHFTPERIRRLVLALSRGEKDILRAAELQLTTPTEAMARSLAALAEEHRDLLVAMLDTRPGPVSDRELAASLRRHRDGPLRRPPAELVDRLTDHFLRVLA
ncbi:MAG: nSTAND3 domain-containing NTPase [Solirubrobacteraceae bacterium]